MLKIDFLKRLAVAALAVPWAAGDLAKADAADDSDVLVGLWDAVIEGNGATYRYMYSIARGSYVATGNIDEAFMNFKYSPSMGAYVRHADGSYKYRERGYVFDMKGHNAGTFTSTGTFRLDADGKTFRGPGIFTQYDLRSHPGVTERFSMVATRISV